jgi:hypothetical protein
MSSNRLGSDAGLCVRGTCLARFTTRTHRHGWFQLADTLARPSCTLVSVNLNNNRIGDRGAIAVADALKRNATLAALTMQRNGLGFRTGSAVLEVRAVRRCCRCCCVEA